MTLAKAMAPFRAPSNKRASAELAATVVPFAVLWSVTSLMIQAGLWFGLVLTIPAGGLLLRLFLIQHDCGHGSFFKRRSTNTWVGRIIGVVTLTPYDFWRRSHAHHHAGTGNLDRRGLGDIDTLTVAEYRDLPARRRLAYRLYRSPFILFGVGPAYQFLLRHRFPAGVTRLGEKAAWSVALTNGAVALVGSALIAWLGVKPFLLIQLPITLVAATSGVWLFYVQHQFSRTSWQRTERWDFYDVALHGSSYLDLPPILRWFTANIGVHHVHHLCSNIPFYQLQRVLRAFPELRTIGRLGLLESLGTVRLALWNEATGRMMSFKDARTA